MRIGTQLFSVGILLTLYCVRYSVQYRVLQQQKPMHIIIVYIIGEYYAI
jgi:hypothetical protein